jgi:hypothetical protein
MKILKALLVPVYFLTAFSCWRLFDINHSFVNLFLSITMTLIFIEQYFKINKTFKSE